MRYRTGIGIMVIPELLTEFLLQFDQEGIEERVALMIIPHFLCKGHAVTGFKLAVGDHIHTCVNAMLLQALNEIVQPFHGALVQRPGISGRLTGGKAENVGGCPIGIHLMEADIVTTGLLQTLSNSLRIGMVREAGCTVKNDTPQLYGCTIFEDEVFTLHAAEAVLTGRLFILKYEGNIHRHHIGILINRHITGHNKSLLFMILWI